MIALSTERVIINITNLTIHTVSDAVLRICIVGPRSGDDALLELSNLPKEARIVATGNTIEELMREEYFLDANVLLNVSGNTETIGPIIDALGDLRWFHSITAGLDHVICPQMTEREDLIVTNVNPRYLYTPSYISINLLINVKLCTAPLLPPSQQAKGVYSSSLAEYVMFACSYFAKDALRLLSLKQRKVWDRFCVGELRGKTMGIIGYGDIGKACAKLAKAYGMNIIAQRRRPELSDSDPLVDYVYGSGPENILELFRQSDYIVIAAPLTEETRGIIGKKELMEAKKGQVLINIGRGPIIDEDALIEVLKDPYAQLVGAALDVFSIEPLPQTSLLWTLPNVLISPHNADMTEDFRHRSVRFFTENCHRFVFGKDEDIHCKVDKKLGY